MNSDALELNIKSSEQESPIIQLEETIKKIGFNNIPFKSTLCFDGLIKNIEDKVANGDHGEQLYAQLVLDRLEAVDFRGPIDGCKISENQEVLELLLLAVIPPSLRDISLVKVSPPLSMDTIYSTPSLSAFMGNYELNFRFTCPTEAAYSMMVNNACCLILNKFYGQNLHIESPLQIIQKDPETGLSRYFKTLMNLDYVDIKMVKPLKPLSQLDINNLFGDIYNTKLWLQHIPPENFEFQGFSLGTLIDITEEETLSRIRYSLLEKNAVTESQNIRTIESLVSDYLNIPGLKLGISAIDYPLENSVSHKYKIHFNFLHNRYPNTLLHSSNEGSVYEEACEAKEIILVENLKDRPVQTVLEKELLGLGINSLLVAPLKNKNDKIIGVVEIGHTKISAINGFVENKFAEIINLFSVAIERSRDEIDNQIEAVIREKYTAIHPSVEWKFIGSSYNYLEKLEQGQNNPSIDSIIFEDVYPLYGQADIVGSSTKRNNAIQADLITNLTLALDLLIKCLDIASYPIVDQYILKVEQNLTALKEVFNSNDESRLLEFFFDEVHPLFHQLSVKYNELKPHIKKYFAEIDSTFGIIYRERKAYEDSVTMLNNAMGNYLEEEQKKSQKVIPHYFEKYKTDGVEYDIYLGQSLLNKDEFNPMFLKNLRLWQLINMVEITRIIEKMQGALPVPLTTAQLVFVYGSTLSIRFRMDEKQFDVDGAYNVRYEILKKRIDKALIEGTNERLTQSGKVAIVYLQEKDRIEYLDYLDYLKERGYIEDNIEDLRLDKLQGVQGLRALRVTVKYNHQ